MSGAERTGMQPYGERRSALAQAIGNGVAVIPGAALRMRNNDTEYEFRQSSDFFYLTGLNEPDAVLVIAPQREKNRTALFVLPRDPKLEIWNGKRYGVAGALEHFGVDAAHEISELDAQLPEYLVSAQTLYYAIGAGEAFDRRILEALCTARHKVRRAGIAPLAISDPAPILHEMRMFKSPQEIDVMRRAGEITKLGHTAAMRATRPGMPEYELEAIIEFEYRRNGAQDVAYPSIVAGGSNATTLHYNTNRETLRDGDLVLVDSGCELDCYAADVTRTWPVNGKFTAEQRAIYEIVLSAQKAAIGEVRVGNLASSYHEVAKRVVVEGLLSLGLLTGSRDENIETERYKQYYMHSAGHWIGLDVHDVGRYMEADGKTSRAFQPGMCTTVEPGIYVREDVDCDERFKGIGVRIEDNILCTAAGPQNLTDGIPKEIDEIESIVGSGAAVGAA